MRNMQSHSVYKIPQGKLLKIFLEYDETNHLIRDIKITGDFFAYPEEAIELMESSLRNTSLDRDVLKQTISSIISIYHMQFIGLNAEGLTQGILMCLL